MRLIRAISSARAGLQGNPLGFVPLFSSPRSQWLLFITSLLCPGAESLGLMGVERRWKRSFAVIYKGVFYFLSQEQPQSWGYPLIEPPAVSPEGGEIIGGNHPPAPLGTRAELGDGPVSLGGFNPHLPAPDTKEGERIFLSGMSLS